MSARMLGHPAITRSGPPGPHRTLVQEPPPRRPGTPPREGEFVRPLTRRQVDDRMGELGELYTRTTSCESGILDPSDPDSGIAFQQRLAGLVRRPGFELLVAEAVDASGATVISACAYGFPVRGPELWWQGLDGYLPETLSRLTSSGKLFAVADILVERRVRTHDQSRDWNLARRLQKRLLADHTGALGVTLVDRDDADTYRALLSWGWRRLPAGARRASLFDSRCLLVLG
ncbi:hypothetical protein [Streptomyces griseorubiginosus]|uniref:hypothetical protein n=1 Tax=Streptomyces griseorubiginosus TaxID=67304 RepID=UPI00364DD18B